MSALKMDEFALEMRLHFIDDAIKTIADLYQKSELVVEFPALIPSWISEARSNEMAHFADFIESLKERITHVEVERLHKILGEYLKVLRNQQDDPVLKQQFEMFLKGSIEKNHELYLQCLNGEHQFVVPVSYVIEIVGAKKIFPLPFQHRGIKGMISFRGQGIPVMNFADFGFSNEARHEKTFYVVCEMHESFFALEVNSTDDVLEIAAKDFQKNNDEAKVLSPVVDQFVLKGEKTLMLLDLEKLVNYE